MTIKTITHFGVLTSVALLLGYFERFIPVAPGLPGVKCRRPLTVSVKERFFLARNVGAMA